MYERLSPEALRKMGERALAKAMAKPEPKGGDPCPAPIVNVTNEIALPDPPMCLEHIVTYNADGRIVKITTTRLTRAST